jgi:ATP-dependent helicase HrpB
MNVLPIDGVIPEILQALRRGNGLVLQAPPGAGKTTRVPLALLDEAWLGGRRIVMLEPRRLATREAARRMAATLGELVGGTVGYRMRMDSKVGKATRIEVVTDGILIRILQDNPALDGIGAVVFDEFHERGLDADLGLALCLEAQRYLREDLRLLVMSATLDGERVATLLGAPMVSSAGRSFPVATQHLPRPKDERVEDGVVAAIRQALGAEVGNILAFLPGAGEIRRVERRLAEARLGPALQVMPLYGELPQAAQDAALSLPPPGVRKIVLATSIAETSLTIEGIRIVVDSGLMRVPRFEPRSGLTRLETVKVSQASADQRRGRAGRLEPGVCYRLWSVAEERLLPRYSVPEMLAADLAPLTLELARWGAEPASLAWLDPPPAAAFAQGRALLERLDALASDGRITAHGKELAGFGLHPRLAHMILRGRALGIGGLACDIAALLAFRDILKPVAGTGAGMGARRDTDLRLRLDVLAGRIAEPAGAVIDRALLRQVRQQAGEWRRRIAASRDGHEDMSVGAESAGMALALAYPDRIAQRRSAGGGQFRLSNGRGASVAAHDPLAAADYIVAAELDGDRRDARVFLAAPVTAGELETAFGEVLERRDEIAWDTRTAAVVARRQLRLGELVVREEKLETPPRPAVLAALLTGIREAGLACLPWRSETMQLRARVACLRRLDGEASAWPNLSDSALLASLEDWLAPALNGIGRLSQLDRIDLAPLLRGCLGWPEQRALDERAPTHVTVPSGSTVPIDYTSGDVPILAVRLQEMFGATASPCIAGGRITLLLHLLSPAGRPLQTTSDLAGFWRGSYHEIRREMRGRYPKHPWPEDPLAAEPTSRAKRRLQ